jgi:uroporphyrin-III C-methyltransferase
MTAPLDANEKGKAMEKVFLVGAGPGDPDLLTVRAARLLRQADVVLHDALVSPAILALTRPDAQVINIGKRCRQKLLTQEEINSLLLFHASKADVVIRLKGGDPAIFARTAEEIDALMQAGIEFEIVPGITAALAGAAAAGISLTDRNVASSVVFATAHRKPGAGQPEWDRLVTSGSTLVIYMPGQDYAELAAQLRAAGLKESTPCVVVSDAGSPRRQVQWCNLRVLARSQALPAPALIILGECARGVVAQLSDQRWAAEVEDRPLAQPILSR